jgi:hypothetical protein
VFGIAQNPLGFAVVWRDHVRRALVLDRFPYALYFTVDDDQVTVIACFHASRAEDRHARHGRTLASARLALLLGRA